MKYFSYTSSKILIVISLVLFIVIGCQQKDASVKLKPMIDKYIEIWNTGNLDALDAIIDPKFEFRMTPKFKATIGIDSLKQVANYYRTAYPDFHIKIDEEFYSEDKAAIIWTITGTNTGPGIFPATGKKINVQGMSIFHFVNNKIFDEWIAGNNLLWFKQLGFTLTPPDIMEK